MSGKDSYKTLIIYKTLKNQTTLNRYGIGGRKGSIPPAPKPPQNHPRIRGEGDTHVCVHTHTLERAWGLDILERGCIGLMSIIRSYITAGGGARPGTDILGKSPVRDPGPDILSCFFIKKCIISKQ